MAQLFTAVPANNLPVVPNYNVCPTTQIHVVRAGDDVRLLVSMRWGLLPKWYKSPNDGPLLINARAETIAEKPAFRQAYWERRCLIPASGFFEWSKDENGASLPWYIQRSDGAPIVLASIWQEWQSADGNIATCAVVTTAANSTMSTVHHRMPVILRPDDFDLWLGQAGKGAAVLMRPCADDELTLFRVSKKVNSSRATGPELIEPF